MMSYNASKLRSSLIRVAYQNPDIRDDLLPLLSPEPLQLKPGLHLAFVDLVSEKENNYGKIVVGVEAGRDVSLDFFDKFEDKNILHPLTREIEQRIASINLLEKKRSYIGRGLFKFEFEWKIDNSKKSNRNNMRGDIRSSLETLLHDLTPKSSVFTSTKE